MTNVPDRLRDMWREVYVLFDTHYLMDVENQDSWTQFWEDAKPIYEKYGDIDSLIDLLTFVSELISKMAARRKTDGTDK